MEKRFVLFLVITVLILLSWSAFVSNTYHLDNKEVMQQKASIVPQPLPAQPPLVALPQEIPNSPTFNFSNNNLVVVFNEQEAAIKEIDFKSYQSYKFSLKHGFLIGDTKLIFKKETSSTDSVSFVYSDQEKKITKLFNFSNSNYGIWLDVKVKNLSSSPLSINLPVFLGEIDFSENPDQARFKDLTIATPEKIVRNNARKDYNFESVKFLGLRDRYFCAILEPETTEHYSGFVKKVSPQISEMGLHGEAMVIPPNQEVERKFHIYLGPQELHLLNAIKPDWTFIVNYGTFDFISQFLLQILGFLFKLSHNWGWAIILLSIIIYFLFYPLTLKQIRSMKEMQALQPLIEDLRKKYKDNPQKLNKEIMDLYRVHKVNPFSGCLPLLLQMPIFFALYQSLMRSVVLRGATFLWIKDLSQPDRLFTLPVSLPVLGNEINILPIVMAIGMFIQQKISLISGSSSTAEQQKIMMIIMPLMFGLIFYHMPAGLVLYWFVNSALMLVYQVRVYKAK